MLLSFKTLSIIYIKLIPRIFFCFLNKTLCGFETILIRLVEMFFIFKNILRYTFIVSDMSQRKGLYIASTSVIEFVSYLKLVFILYLTGS